MESICALQELPPELRNNIYEHAALNEGTLRIKKTLRPRTGGRIALRSALILANRQLSTEYVSVVQKVAFWKGSKLESKVYDFNFKPLQKFISSLSQSELAALDKGENIKARLIISALRNAEIEILGRCLAFFKRNTVNIEFYVDDAESGYVYPQEPPNWYDLMPLRRTSGNDFMSAKLYTALEDWQDRCRRRRYEFLVTSGTSTTAVYLEWKPNRTPAYSQFSLDQEDDDSEALWWTFKVEGVKGSKFEDMARWQEVIDRNCAMKKA